MNRKPQLLLTTAYGPYELGRGEDMHDAFTARLSRGHGAFSMSSHFHYFGLHLLAENISLPTTILEDPLWEEFELELEKGYEYIGFQLKSLSTDKIADMVQLVRHKSPGSKVILGGYGVGTLEDPVPGDKRGSARFLLENSDFLCREEGVGFMRRILDDGPADRPITQNHLPFAGFSLRPFKRRRLRVPVILVALGCPNACDFCATSAFFHHKKIQVADPEETYRFMKNYAQRLRSKGLYTLLFDEDIFQNAEFVRELGRLIRSDRNTWNYKWFGFGSVSALAQYSPEELRDSGVFMVWVGVESLLCDDPDKAGADHLPKRRGDVEGTIRRLQQNGILTVGSTVLGFDFHTPENIEQDIDNFVGLRPTFYQIGALTPCPGTALYNRMKEEGRIHEDYKWADIHLWKEDIFKFKHFQGNEMVDYVHLAHKKIVEENGPPLISVIETFLNGYESLNGCSSDFHRSTRASCRRIVSLLRGTLRPIAESAPSQAARARAAELDKRVREVIGVSSPTDRILGRLARWAYNRVNKEAAQPIVSNPPTKWTYYHLNPNDEVVYVRNGRGNAKMRKRRERVRLFG
jgi:haloalkane dehalogenase